MSMDGQPTLGDLESLFVNNAEIDEIRAYLSRFNPIKTMGVEQKEIRHSYILRWLLDPQESHGLGDKFLKAFLSEALRGHVDSAHPSALDVYQADMTDAEVRREWRNIDLLVLSPKNGWVFVIENKINSAQHSDQLKRYLEIANSAFVEREGETYKFIRGVFLTLWEEDPKDDRYTSIKYDSICELLEQQVLSGRQSLTAEVETFLKHYLEIIQEATGMSKEHTEVEKLARQLYRNHRRVLDFVVEHGKSTDFAIACEDLFGANLANLEYPAQISADGFDLVFGWAGSSKFSFLPKSWFDAFGGDDFWWHGCEEWWSGFPLIMWVELYTNPDDSAGQVGICGLVGPLTDYGFRLSLIEAITGVANKRDLKKIKFQSGATKEGRKYSQFLKSNWFKIDDVQDSESIGAAILEALKSFRDETDAVAEVLPQFLKHGYTDDSE